MTTRLALALAGAGVLGGGGARAEEGPGPVETTEQVPHDLTGRVDLYLEHSMSRSPGNSFAPDLYVDVSSDLQLSFVNSHRSRWLVGTGRGWCFDCDELFERDVPTWSGTGVAARWRFLLGGVHFDRFSPVKPWVQLGGYYRWSRSIFAVETQPYVGIALANRDDGNASFINLAARFRVSPLSWLHITVDPSFNSHLDDFRDWYTLALAGGIEVSSPWGWSAGVYLGYPKTYGQLNDSGERHLAIRLSWAPRGL